MIANKEGFGRFVYSLHRGEVAKEAKNSRGMEGVVVAIGI